MYCGIFLLPILPLSSAPSPLAGLAYGLIFRLLWDFYAFRVPYSIAVLKFGADNRFVGFDVNYSHNLWLHVARSTGSLKRLK